MSLEMIHYFLSDKMDEAVQEEEQVKERKRRYKKPTPTYFEKTIDQATRQITRDVSRGIARGILGVLGLGNKRSKKSKGWFF